MDVLSGLNPQQEQAVTVDAGPVLVLAGPGSGKTRVLTWRIAYLIDRLGLNPYRILAVTFTNKAAREMEARVARLLGRAAGGLSLGTFHAFCARLLRREAEHLPFKSNFVIFDSDDQLNLVKRALKELNIDEKNHRPTSVHGAISRAKNELVFPEEYPVSTYRDEVVQRVYQRYQQLLMLSNALDFDDLLLWAVNLLESQPEVKERYAQRFVHVLVDEFQDTNTAQYTLLKHLSAQHGNLFVVGDSDQSIYRWRGADYRNVLRFQRDFPAARVLLLEQNYRSTQGILEVAMAVINPNPHRVPKRLFTERGWGQKVEYRELYDDREEAEFVVQTISRMVSRRQAHPGDFAVMYRTNAQSRLVEEAFLRAGIPYKLVGAQRFYGRREIKDVIAYLRLVHNPEDEVSLMRVIGVPPRGIGTKTLAALRTQARKVRMTPGDLLLDLSRGAESQHWEAFPARAAVKLSHFGRLLQGWRQALSHSTPMDLMDRVLADVGYRQYIDDGTDEGSDRWENVQELRRLASEFSQRGLEAFLEEVALVSDQDTLDEKARVPTLLTLHAAKGLEFPVVFIIGLDDGILPHLRSFDDPDAMEEERRLLYVGITRAKDRLFLLRSQQRNLYGYSEPMKPSRYLEDVPPDLIVGDPLCYLGRRREEEWLPVRPTRTVSQTIFTPKNTQPRFRAGMRVRHNLWGEGMVVNSKLDGEDEIVELVFESVGIKRVAASLAKLEIL